MGTFVSVASEYTIYELDEEAFQMAKDGELQYPPQVALEVMVLAGKAKGLAL